MNDTTQLELPEVSGPMSATQLRMMQRAIDILRNLPVQFVVVAPGDRVFKYGDWELVPKKQGKQRRAYKYERGAVRNHIRPYLDNLQAGEVVEIPVGEFDVAAIQSNVSNYARLLWGEGNHTTTRARDHSYVELYRAV